uniref:transporter substrate-binding domain-containing protein n=1 Tax=Thauera sp. SDU_THAU2 TaxID=3136633 RepID=UPI00311DD838
MALLAIAAMAVVIPGGIPREASAERLPADTRLRIGLVDIAQPRSDSRDYTADGLQPAFVEEIGRHLDVVVELVPLPAGQAQAALGGGEVDALLVRGTPAELPPGAKLVDTGFTSGLDVLMRSDTTIRRWDQLAGRTLCVTSAHAEAQALAHVLGAQTLSFEAPAQALVAMRTGQCDASLHDAVLLDALRGKDEWRKFSASLGARQPAVLRLVLPPESPTVEAALRRALKTLDGSAHWQRRADQWASNVAFEVFFDQIGPDCH